MSFLKLNNYIREKYNEVVDQVNIPALITAKFSSTGGVFTLYYKGKKYVSEPVPILYQYLKSVSHIPLALLTDNTDGIYKRIYDLYMEVSSIPNKGKEMLLIQEILDKAYHWDGTEDYLVNILWPLLAKAMTYAVEIQVCAIRHLLDKWTSIVNNAYGLVISKWETSEENIHYNILKQYIPEERLLLTENPNEEDAIHTLRRNILDRNMVHSIIPDPELVHSYSGRRDLLSLEALKVLKCPYR